MAFGLTSSGACIAKAGANCDPNFRVSGAYVTILSNFCDQAEAQLAVLTRTDWLTISGSLKANTKQILSDVVSDMVAMKVINHNMNGYTSRSEAETMLNVLRDNFTRNVEALKDEKFREIM